MATAVHRDTLPDIQNKRDTRGKHIERAGIENVRIPIAIARKKADGIPTTVQAEVSMYVSVDHEIKGANMCYDEETEILTQDGWRLFKNLKGTDQVATLNIQSNEFEWQLPSKHYVGDYKGKMFTVQCRGIDLRVTPNHTLVVQKGELPPQLITASKFFGKTGFSMLKTSNWEGDNPENFTISTNMKTYKKKQSYTFSTLDFMKLLGFFLAEGCTNRPNAKQGHYQVIWSNGDREILGKLSTILEKVGIKSWISSNGSVYNLGISNKCLFDYFSELKGSINRFIPKDIKNLAPELLQTLFMYYMIGDGSSTSNKSKSFCTSSKLLADDLQEIGVKCGFGVHIKKSIKGAKSFKPGGIYYIGYISNNITPNINPSRNSKARNKWTQYNGQVYCCEVENRTLLTRRNGIPIWSGNSRFLECLMSYESVVVTSGHLKEMMDDMLDRLESIDGYIRLKFLYFLPRYAPVSKIRGVQGYEVSFIGRQRKGKYDFVIEVEVVGTNLCPCSKEISDYGAHNQRNHVKVQLVHNDKLYWIEDIIETIEGTMSCPIFPVLKREDEKWVTEKAFENPKFVEDLARDVALALDSYGINHYHIKSRADESIHHHEAAASLSKDWILE